MQQLNNMLSNYICLAEIQETMQWYIMADNQNEFCLSIPNFNKDQSSEKALSHLVLHKELDQIVGRVFNAVREHSSEFVGKLNGEDVTDLQSVMSQNSIIIQETAPSMPSLDKLLSNIELLAYWILNQQNIPPLKAFMKAGDKIIKKMANQHQLEQQGINFKIKSLLTTSSSNELATLLKQCPDVNAELEPNKTLLYFACENNVAEIISLLIKNGATADGPCIGLALKQDNKAQLKQLLSNINKDFINKVDTLKLLKQYAPYSLGKLLPLLLEKLPKVSPYYLRELIIEQDADIALEYYLQKGEKLESIYSDALDKESPRCLEKTLKNRSKLKGKVEFNHFSDLKALVIIAEYDNKPLQHYFDIGLLNLTKQDNTGNRLLHEVVRRCNVEQLKYFLTITGMNVNQRTSDGNVALLLTVNQEKIKVLIDAGADLDLLITNDESILSKIDESLIILLLEAGANPNVVRGFDVPLIIRAIEEKSCYLDAILKTNVNVNDCNILQKYLSKPEVLSDILPTLIDLGINFNQTNVHGLLMSHALCALYPKNIVEKAINAGYCDIKKVDKNGFTSFIQASLSNNIEVLELLASKGVNVNHKTNLNFSALTYAIYRNDETMVRCLIKLGADSRQKTQGKTQLELCKALYYEKLVPLLK